MVELSSKGLSVQASDNTLLSLFQMMESSVIDMVPKFQRRDRWNDHARSLLIESFLLNLPVPPIYLSEESTSYKVIDGKQRLTAIRNFFRNDFKLQGLDYLCEFEGMTCEMLPEEQRHKLDFRPLRTVIVQRNTNELLTRTVFRRLNTEGKPLNAQEIRNALFDNPLNDKIHSLAENPILLESLKIKSTNSPAYKRMDDLTYVLRFITMVFFYPKFLNDQSTAMDTVMDLSEGGDVRARKIHGIADSFPEILLSSQKIFGRKRFKRWVPESGWRDQVIGGLFDAEMVSLYNLKQRERQVLEQNSEEFLAHFRNIFVDTEFVNSFTSSTNTPSKVVHRIDAVSSVIDDFLNNRA
ncbi:DUF262 domain-containing protein [Corynebacterium aurimucosum]|uniref:DUF262 domain-containing protein n=1 Tax=Corynebacterium aurimucosum TaxID=169292 RepID=A0A558IZ37_9CORY|nr:MULTISPECIES: DUF262 domain-containing protein [Corynebacterium]OFQ54621.1 hypothetical protein HMPREF2932_12535 [Corynebacterium sp. HMSC074H12]TVU86653.1 DUF262 domain-containing protein [Corynebacterium aurimucosum]